MPAKNRIKEYEENSFYHIYNRGVERRRIFIDQQDYSVFLSYLKFYLLTPVQNGPKVPPSHKLKNYFGGITLLCYCLMPNHFHLLIHQRSEADMTEFMRSLLTRYSMYFNRKYQRVGSLFQGRYKAVKVTSEQQLVYLSHYIHRNPHPSGTDPEGWVGYHYSSLPNYLGKIKQDWVVPDRILDLFSRIDRSGSYFSFVSDSAIQPDSSVTLADTSGTDPEG